VGTGNGKASCGRNELATREGGVVDEVGKRWGGQGLREQMKAMEKECAILKGELEAQWQHPEKALEKIKSLEKDRCSSRTRKRS
jgi:hypothetical protein